MLVLLEMLYYFFIIIWTVWNWNFCVIFQGRNVGHYAVNVDDDEV